MKTFVLCVLLIYHTYVSLFSINIHIVPIRLVGTGSHNYGRVEVYYNGEWGTVCDDGWDTADATVVCRQLGFYSSAYAYRSAAHYGQGTGPIWLSKLSCFGNESNLFECAQLNISTKNCTHSDDAAVQCYYYVHSIRRKYLVNSCLILQNLHKLLNDRSTN